MEVKKTKKLNAQTATTTVANGEKFAKVDPNGNVTLIDINDLKTALLGGMNLDSMMDGVFIMYHPKNSNTPFLVKPHKWTSLQNSGEIADGVAVVEGGKVLVVAPTGEDIDAGLLWSSAAVSGGATTTGDRLKAMDDWNGKANTAAIIAKSTSAAVTNTAAYAPGFCSLYSRTNATGQGLTAGKWWLPSVGEMFMIFANLTKINYCLSLISGATPLIENWYWTSTETSSTNAWVLSLKNSDFGNWGQKVNHKGMVRPVSAYIN